MGNYKSLVKNECIVASFRTNVVQNISQVLKRWKSFVYIIIFSREISFS